MYTHQCMLCVFLSRPSTFAVLATRIQLDSAHASMTTSLPSRETFLFTLLGARRLSHEAFSPAPFRSRETVSHLNLSFSPQWLLIGSLLHFVPTSEYIDLAHCDHCYTSKITRSRRPCSQPAQWKRYGTRPTALSNVAALHIGGKEILFRLLVWFCLKPENSHSHGFELYRPSIKNTIYCCKYKSNHHHQPGVVRILRVTTNCLRSTSALKNIHRSMRWQPFFLFYFQIQTEPYPCYQEGQWFRTTTSFSRQLTFTLSSDPLPGFFQLS